jgi:hypothetical protein
MPVCKNDPTKKYKGTEPSPKGLGYCAHAQALGSKKTGLDGKKYQVRADKNGRLSWKLVKSEKKVKAVVGAKKKAKDDKKVIKAVVEAVAVGGPAAVEEALDKIKEIQARLQTAKRFQIDEYLKAKKKQGLFKKAIKAKGYGIQNARADAIAIRGTKGIAQQQQQIAQQQHGVIDFFKLTGHQANPNADVEIVFHYPKQVMDIVESFSDINRPRPTTQQQQQQQQRKFEQGIKNKERALWEKVEAVLAALGIKDFEYNEVSYASELTFERIWIRPKDFTHELVKNLKKALPAGYSMSLQVVPNRWDAPGVLMPL